MWFLVSAVMAVAGVAFFRVFSVEFVLAVFPFVSWVAAMLLSWERAIGLGVDMQRAPVVPQSRPVAPADNVVPLRRPSSPEVPSIFGPSTGGAKQRPVALGPGGEAV